MSFLIEGANDKEAYAAPDTGWKPALHWAGHGVQSRDDFAGAPGTVA